MKKCGKILIVVFSAVKSIVIFTYLCSYSCFRENLPVRVLIVTEAKEGISVGISDQQSQQKVELK